MIRQKRPALILAFDSTAQALAAETLFTKKGFPGRIVPLPAQVSAGCGLAWKAGPEQKQSLLDALSQAQQSYAACVIVEMFG